MNDIKYIKLRVSPDLHKEIKLKAVEAGKSMHQYILDCVEGEYHITPAGNKCWCKDEEDLIDSRLHKCSRCERILDPALDFWAGNKEEVICKDCYEPKEFCQKCRYPLKEIDHTCK